MATNAAPSFALSQEELFVIMKYLGIEMLPGFDLEAFRNLNNQQMNLMVNIADRALLARGFLKLNSDGHLQLKAIFTDLFSTCIHAEKSLIISNNRPNVIEEDFFFHILDDMVVMHSIPIPTIHQFIAGKEKTAIFRTTMWVLNTNSKSTLKNAKWKIPKAVWENAKIAAKETKESDEVFRILSMADLSKETALELSKAITKPLAITAISCVTKGKPIDDFTILQGDNSFWLLEPCKDTPNDFIFVSSATSQIISKRIKNLLN